MRWGATFWVRAWVYYGRWMLPFVVNEAGRRHHARYAKRLAVAQAEEDELFESFRRAEHQRREREEQYRRDVATIAAWVRATQPSSTESKP
jgi:hypothetical protein